jgi:hypothetical protein
MAHGGHSITATGFERTAAGYRLTYVDSWGDRDVSLTIGGSTMAAQASWKCPECGQTMPQAEVVGHRMAEWDHQELEREARGGGAVIVWTCGCLALAVALVIVVVLWRTIR